MKVAKELLDKWKDLALFGDGEAISQSMPEDTRVTGQTIRTLIRTGEYRSLNVLEAVIAFYKERDKKVKGMMNDALNGAELDAINKTPIKDILPSKREIVQTVVENSKPWEDAGAEPMVDKPKGVKIKHIPANANTGASLKGSKFLEQRRKNKTGQK